jgi:iron complex outermembrane recepter protein
MKCSLLIFGLLGTLATWGQGQVAIPTPQVAKDTTDTNGIKTWQIPSIKYNDIGFRLDSVVYYMVLIEGFGGNKIREKEPASVSLVGQDILRSGDQTSLQTALNSVPGVMMESRGAGGSHRISIRGSALRAPFAVRNIKMYVDGIPFTSPDGQSPLEVIDAGDLQSVEVMRGPSGTIWGAGNGGVLQFKLSQPLFSAQPKVLWSSTGQAGSFDQYRMNHAVEVGLETWAIRFSQTNQSVDGYRQQEFNRKSSSLLTLRHKLNERHVVQFVGLAYTGNWGLPGGQTAAQRDLDRTLAIPYSVERNASVWRDRQMMGLSHTYYATNGSKWTTSINAYGTDKTNPYGTSNFRNGFKVEKAGGGGLRSVYTQRLKKSTQYVHQLIIGIESQLEHYFIEETKNNFGKPGDFKYQYNVNYGNAALFALADFNWHYRFGLQVGATAMQERQEVSGYNAAGWATDTLAHSAVQIMPRVASTWSFCQYWNMFVALGVGNSMPTVFELVDYENNQYNLDLAPERAFNREVGVKYNNYVKERMFEIAYYYTNVRGIILSETVQVPDPNNPSQPLEIDQFANRGVTAQQGLEVTSSLSWKTTNNKWRLQWQSSGSWNRYRFVAYEAYQGRRLPGMPEVQWFNHVRLTWKQQYSVGTMLQYVGPIDLVSSNEVRSTDYAVINVYGEFFQELGKRIKVSARGGVNNVTDEHYSGYYNYNDVNGRYYNAALPVNYFGLLSLEIKLMR